MCTVLLVYPVVGWVLSVVFISIFYEHAHFLCIHMWFDLRVPNWKLMLAVYRLRMPIWLCRMKSICKLKQMEIRANVEEKYSTLWYSTIYTRFTNWRWEQWHKSKLLYTEPGNLVEIYDRLRNLYLRVLYLKRTVGVVNITLTNWNF